MASFRSSIGSSFSWICGGELELGSYCTQRTIINGINLLFLCVFLLFTLVSTIRKHYITVPARRDQFSLAISICCALTSIAYFAAGLWDLISESDDQSEHFVRLDYFARGLIWISFTASLLVQSSKWIKILNSVWWFSSFSMASALNIEILVRTHSIQMFDAMTWPVGFLLLLCAIRNLSHFVHQHAQENSLSEPLLTKKIDGKEPEIRSRPG